RYCTRRTRIIAITPTRGRTRCSSQDPSHDPALEPVASVQSSRPCGRPAHFRCRAGGAPRFDAVFVRRSLRAAGLLVFGRSVECEVGPTPVPDVFIDDRPVPDSVTVSLGAPSSPKQSELA